MFWALRPMTDDDRRKPDDNSRLKISLSVHVQGNRRAWPSVARPSQGLVDDKGTDPVSDATGLAVCGPVGCSGVQPANSKF
jgi:hypothetical protein